MITPSLIRLCFLHLYFHNKNLWSLKLRKISLSKVKLILVDSIYIRLITVYLQANT